MSKPTKVRETDTHVYFLNGPLSQWHRGIFLQQVEQGGDQLKFNCCEQYMMASKAHLFGDKSTFDAIMRANEPRDQKGLGRQVANFNEHVWREAAPDIVFRGNWAKHSQVPEAKAYLLSTGDKYLVEGSAYDRIWGVGISWDDDRILNEENWQGTNLLGESLMQVRNFKNILIKGRESNPTLVFNEWTRDFR